MKSRFLNDAKQDLADCSIWFENRSAGLGIAFLEAIEMGISKILESPQLFSPTDEEIIGYETRVYAIRKFNFFITYLVEPDEIIVLAIDRRKRRSETWIERLNELLPE